MQIRENMDAFVGCAGAVYQRIFHKRNIIIVSERKVKHVPISGALQLTLVLAGVSAVFCAALLVGLTARLLRREAIVFAR